MSANKPPSAVRTSLGDFAPKLVDLTEDVLFGDVWERPQLSKRDRSLITCAALIATGELERQNSEHLGFIAHELRNPLGSDHAASRIGALRPRSPRSTTSP
jgi:alkylhydroperoxidase/carboxymuconolactone decarboxylase family protein YurZ